MTVKFMSDNKVTLHSKRQACRRRRSLDKRRGISGAISNAEDFTTYAAIVLSEYFILCDLDKAFDLLSKSLEL